MEIAFVDTSALAKRYVDEAGSAWVLSLFSEDDSCLVYIAELTTVELTSAVVRRSKGGSLSAATASEILSDFDLHLLTDYFILEITSDLLANACGLVKVYGLRSYDAVQIATAGDLNRSQTERGLPSIVFISSDNELLAAAKSEGLSVENPNNYHKNDF